MVSLESLSRIFFDYRGEITEKFVEKIVNMPIWDVRQCEVCKETVVVPYGAPIYYHIDHYPQGKYESIIEKPMTLKDIMNHFRVDKVYMVDEKELALIRKIFTR